MKYRIIFITVFFVSNLYFVQAQTASELWDKTFVHTVQNSAGISFFLTVDGISDGSPFNMDTVCHMVSTADAMWHTDGIDGLKNLWITRDTFCLFNRRTDDIVYGTTWKDNSHTEHSSAFSMLIYPQQVAWGWISHYMPLYFAQWRFSFEKYVPEGVSDTIWNGQEYWLFQTVDHSVGAMDGDTFVPNDDTIFYYVDKKSSLVHRVDVCTHNRVSGHKIERYLFHDVKVLDSVPALGAEWDINNPIYANTPKYNVKQHIPASLACMRVEERYKITDQQLLDYPLLDVNGDTVSIGQMKGWVLIDIFRYGCRPCAEFHKMMQDESQKDGLCQFEKNGIRVVCIHPATGLSVGFKQYVERFGLQNKAYCARELTPLLDGLNYYPKYYLLSPDKKIVLEDTCDIKTVIEKMKEYETSY